METVEIIDSILRSRNLNESYRELKKQNPQDYHSLLYVNHRLYEETFFRYSNCSKESQNKEFLVELMEKLNQEAEEFNSVLSVLGNSGSKLNDWEDQ